MSLDVDSLRFVVKVPNESPLLWLVWFEVPIFGVVSFEEVILAAGVNSIWKGPAVNKNSKDANLCAEKRDKSR
jgi:hypothetical protein